MPARGACALAPGQPGAWDDYTTWTGSVLHDQDRWWTFYTGASRQERGKVQRVELAASDDLIGEPADPVPVQHNSGPLVLVETARENGAAAPKPMTWS